MADQTIIGTDSSETLQGSDGDDLIQALGGNDALHGQAGDDTLEAGGGNDFVFGEEDDDALYGGSGHDQMFGGDGDDRLEGGSGDDVLYGGNPGVISPEPGQDALYGGSGNDILLGGFGSDIIDGGGGIDTFFSDPASSAALIVNLAAGTATSANGIDTVSSIEIVYGSVSGDMMAGDGFANTLYGLGGSDALDGGAGDDILEGGIGNDALVGGEGNDTASYAHAAGSAVVVNLATGSATGEGSDTLSMIENVIGSAFNDTLTGDTVANRLEGRDGNDRLASRGGDILDGGNGLDTADYSSVTGGASSGLPGVQLDLNTGRAIILDKAQDLLVSIENVIGSTSGDHLIGDALANTLDGGAGGDRLEGREGDDILIGGADADMLNGGDGNDTFRAGGGDALDGGNGIDTVDYSGVSGGATSGGIAVQLDLTARLAIITGKATDTLVSIENATGSMFLDYLVGDALANTLDGNAGEDRLEGLQGDDVLLGGNEGDQLNGGEGNDTLIGGKGDDDILGSLGIDTVEYSDSQSAVTVDLQSRVATGGAGTDTLSQIENATGSGFDDTLRGDRFANTLDGGDGNDTLFGDNGDDRLVGGNGVDTALFSGAGSEVVVQLTAGTASSSMGNDTLLSIENVTGGAFGDTLTGDANNNVLTGRDGNDRLTGGAGNDTLDGGQGIDRAIYAHATSGVEVFLAGIAVSEGETDFLNSIEYVSGSAFDDRLHGFESADTLVGADGNDVLLAQAGDDRLTGGKGDDHIDGDIGQDMATYTSASSAVAVDLLGGTSSGGDGNDTLVSIEDVTGSAFNDTLRGDGSVNVLAGGGGNDVLGGGDGEDRLKGEDGVDILRGGAGRDVLVGGADGDFFDFNAVSETAPTMLGADLVADFEQGSDKIDLGSIDANAATAGNQAFAFIGAAAFSGVAGQLRAEVAAGFTFVTGDVDADSIADFQVQLTGVYTLTAVDFVA